MGIAERRAEIVAEHAAMERHNPAWKGTGIQDRPIAFLCDDTVVVTGGCVPKIVEGLRTFFQRERHNELRAAREVDFRHALQRIGKFLEHPPAEIRVHQQVWNSYLLGLNEVGVNVVLTDGANV